MRSLLGDQMCVVLGNRLAQSSKREGWVRCVVEEDERKPKDERK